MARLKVRLDHDGIHELLNSVEFELAVLEEAEYIEAVAGAHHSVFRHDVDVVLDVYHTDRVAASVTLAHPAGLNIDAKYGVLSQYASGRGRK